MILAANSWISYSGSCSLSNAPNLQRSQTAPLTGVDVITVFRLSKVEIEVVNGR